MFPSAHGWARGRRIKNHVLRFCGKHCPAGMVDILDRHCKQTGCDRQPIYGNSGEKAGRPLWCPDHRPSDSVDVKTSRCQAGDCLKHPR